MALPQGTGTNDSGIDPGGTTYLTEIRKVTRSVRIEAMDGDGVFQESSQLRDEIEHTLKGYGHATCNVGLNSLTEVADGPFIDSVQNDDDSEELDTFTVTGHEYA